jgi:hypothetical protein
MDGLDAVIASRLRAKLDSNGTRREDFARDMSALGFRWTGNRVTQVVTGRRPMSMLELAAACSVLGVSLKQLLLPVGHSSSSEVVLSEDATVPLRDVVDALADGSRTWARRSAHESLLGRLLGGSTEANYKAARRLEVPAEEVDAAARTLWGRPLAEERDGRVEEVQGEDPRVVQARRGHVTRALLDELRAHFASARRP